MYFEYNLLIVGALALILMVMKMMSAKIGKDRTIFRGGTF